MNHTCISLQLATNDLYQDFILLDPCDAVAVDEFLKGNKAGKGQNGTHRGSSARRSFQSPTRHSGGTVHKSSLRKSQDASISQFPGPNSNSDVNNNNVGADPPACENLNGNNWGLDMDERYSEPGDFDDEDDNDPWKPLNPHEPGNLKVKPFRKGCSKIYYFSSFYLLLQFSTASNIAFLFSSYSSSKSF